MYWFNPLFPDIYLSGNATGKKTLNKLAKMENQITFQNVFANNVITALSRYRLTGDIPETINPRVFMQSLLWYGTAIIFNKNDNWLCLPGVPDGSGINIYGDFSGGWVFGANGFNENVPLYMPGENESFTIKKTVSGANAKNARGVLIRENKIMYPFVNIVMQYSMWIADTYRTLDVAKNHLKHPYIVVCDESEVNTVKKWFDETKNNVESIVSSGVFPADRVRVQDINTPPGTVTSVTSLCEWYRNGFKSLCGIAHSAQADKKGENLLTDEIHIDDEMDSINITACIDSINAGLADAEKIGCPYMRVVAHKANDIGGDDIAGNNDI